ncbi:MAG: rRNA pseudouridine synthase [Bdellovibrionaceae bacterium]|nr:rRNA pseudouridine synthase [Pseudobdellovibrionaceae bacterium]
MSENQDEKYVRLSKLMSEEGICSRREADDLIEKGYVFVNGERVETLGVKFPHGVDIKVSQLGKKLLSKKKTVILYKPVGYVSHGDDEGNYPCAIDLINNNNLVPNTQGVKDFKELREGLAPAGRLDIDSKGMLVLTQDGKIAKQIIGETSRMDKEYLVRVTGRIIDNGLDLLRHGLELDGEPLKPAKVDWINKDQLKFVLIEGKKRQIRRMCELVGLEVTGLKRVRIGRVTIGSLREGQWRLLGPDERF